MCHHILNIPCFFVGLVSDSSDVSESLLFFCFPQSYHHFVFFPVCLIPLMDSCGALPQQQQLHGLHLFGNWQQRLQPELFFERLRPAWAVQQAGFGKVHRRLPATRGSVECEPTSTSVRILNGGLSNWRQALLFSKIVEKLHFLATLPARL